ncbi:MAG: ATP-NAD kinase family protein, partial [Thermoplasmata archaeon]|nr:ATP-NAD kinase family protein [Thermoplasmata archaeon]
IAGMGGSVGLKGTDGDRYERSLEKGAVPVAPERARQFLQGLKVLDLQIVTVEGPMGEEVCKAARIDYESLPFDYHERTTCQDTAKAAKTLLSAEVDLFAFVGGDGTARDVYSMVGQTLPLVGVPAGVKMFSAVFSPTPSEACGAVEEYMDMGLTTEVEVLDVDEEAYAHGSLSTRLFGIALVPSSPHLVCVGKHVIFGESEEEMKDAIAEYMVELANGHTVVLGPGSTVDHIAREMGIEGTLLGVDVVRGGEMIVRDGGAKDIEPHVDERTLLVVSPIGAQGYFLGRGTQQFTPTILKKAGLDNLMVVSTSTKLKSTPILRVDTGDPGLDEELRGYKKVVTGYHETKIVKVA